jgi:hypothetical protein
MVCDMNSRSYGAKLNVLATTATRRKSPSLYASYFVPLDIVPLLVMDNLVDARFGNQTAFAMRCHVFLRQLYKTDEGTSSTRKQPYMRFFRSPRTLTVQRKTSLHFSNLLTMLTHSASSGSRQTGSPARLYQYAALL